MSCCVKASTSAAASFVHEQDSDDRKVRDGTDTGQCLFCGGCAKYGPPPGEHAARTRASLPTGRHQARAAGFLAYTGIVSVKHV